MENASVKMEPATYQKPGTETISESETNPGSPDPNLMTIDELRNLVSGWPDFRKDQCRLLVESYETKGRLLGLVEDEKTGIQVVRGGMSRESAIRRAVTALLPIVEMAERGKI